MDDLEEIVIDGKRTGTEQPPRQETALTTMDGYMEEVHFIMVSFLGFKCYVRDFVLLFTLIFQSDLVLAHPITFFHLRKLVQKLQNFSYQ